MTTRGKLNQNSLNLADVFNIAVEEREFHCKSRIVINFPVTPPVQIKINPSMRTTTNARTPANRQTIDKDNSRDTNAALSLDGKPFTELMLNPEKLQAALKTASAETISPASSKKKTAARAAKSSVTPTVTLGDSSKETSFTFVATNARSVKLVGDFTDWEKASIDMAFSTNGRWSTVVPLKPGQYAYRFIVDGQWQEDPNCHQKVGNPFGTHNSVVEVV